MRLSPPSLLVAVVLSTIAGCKLNSVGLEPGGAAKVDVIVPDASTAGAGGEGADTGAAGAGAAGATPIGGANGAAGDGLAGAGAAGDGTAGDGLAGTGAAGDGLAGSGAAGDSTGAAGGGAAGAQGPPDASGAAGATNPISPRGCADGTREGFTSLDKYPDIAACAGGWQVSGLVAPETMTPQCNRAAGNDSSRLDGEGCSVADLCADGWHVCESAHEVQTKAGDCRDALTALNGATAFFATRQRGPMMTCDPDNQTGTNNVYGCGNFGSTAMAACAPFTRMLRDADCKANPPWMCVAGPIDYNVSELLDVTKPGSTKGGVLCCR